MGSTISTYHKEQNFATKYFTFFKYLIPIHLAKWFSVRLRTRWLWVRVPLQSLNLSLRTSYKQLIKCTNYPNVHIHILFISAWVLWVCFFPLNIHKVHTILLIKTKLKFQTFGFSEINFIANVNVNAEHAASLDRARFTLLIQ